MLRGLYTSAAGMMTVQEQTATTSNNLANIDTMGFKADLLRFVSAPAIHTWKIDDPATTNQAGQTQPEYLGLTNCGTADTEIWRNFDQGQLLFTGQELDVAIDGPGFFRVISQTGEEVYTRDGQFKHEVTGYLVDNLGRRVQGANGDIFLGDSNDVYINQSGEVHVDGIPVDTIDLAYFSDPQVQLSKLGENAWRSSSAPDGVGDSRILGGYLERSNVDTVSCITELILQLRHYQAMEKSIAASNDTLNIAANQIGVLPQ